MIEALNKLIGWKTYRDRLTPFLLTVLFGIVIADSAKAIDIGKWGYAALFSIIVLVVNFYFRKIPDSEKKP